MTAAPALAGQTLAYLAFAAAVGALSIAPAYSPLGENDAMLRLSFAHAGARKVECRPRPPEEIAALPPNMRQSLDCPRERRPVHVQLEVNGRLLYDRPLPPSGLWHDGASHAYERFRLPAGRYRLTARLRDSAREAGFDHERDFELDIAAGQNVVVDFKTALGGFILR